MTTHPKSSKSWQPQQHKNISFELKLNKEKQKVEQSKKGLKPTTINHTSIVHQAKLYTLHQAKHSKFHYHFVDHHKQQH